MIIVEYPVALVLKGWHLLLTALGMDHNQAWLVALVLLVITIRSLLLPLYYRQMRSGRILANLRPQLRQLEADYADRHDQASRKELMNKRKEIQRENNYKMADGCLPSLVLVPVIIGLYRLLIRIARPSEGLEAAHAGFGPLTGADVDSFLKAEFFGVPLPAYFQMPHDQLAILGTTRQDVLHVALPLAIIASIFTTSNWAYTMKRNLRSLDYGSAANRTMLNIFWVFGPIIMVSPFLVGFGGPGPVALLIYWVCNNFWTATQAVAVQRYLDHTHPYTEAFDEYTQGKKRELKERRSAIRTARRRFKANENIRGARLTAGWDHGAIAHEAAKEREEFISLVDGPKAERLKRKQERKRQRAEERKAKAAQAAAKKQGGQAEQPAKEAEETEET